MTPRGSAHLPKAVSGIKKGDPSEYQGEKGAFLGKSKGEIYGCHDKAILHHAGVCPNMFRETAYKKGREAGRDMHSSTSLLTSHTGLYWSLPYWTAILHHRPSTLGMLLEFLRNPGGIHGIVILYTGLRR